MTSRAVVDLFAEDRAHEEFLRAMVGRLAREDGKGLDLRVRSARGGHGRAIAELQLYQRAKLSVGGGQFPDILVVAIDANCKPFAKAKKEIEESLRSQFVEISAIACPEPHIERWFMADPASFKDVLGVSPKLEKQKCDRDRYKNLLASTVEEAGYTPLLGGIEFARELVEAMDLQRASAADRSLHAFIDAMTARLKGL